MSDDWYPIDWREVQDIKAEERKSRYGEEECSRCGFSVARNYEDLNWDEEAVVCDRCYTEFTGEAP